MGKDLVKEDSGSERGVAHASDSERTTRVNGGQNRPSQGHFNYLGVFDSCDSKAIGGKKNRSVCQQNLFLEKTNVQLQWWIAVRIRPKTPRMDVP